MENISAILILIILAALCFIFLRYEIKQDCKSPDYDINNDFAKREEIIKKILEDVK